MDTDKPYKFHSDVIKKYPPGQMKKKKKGKGKKKHKDKGKGKDKKKWDWFSLVILKEREKYDQNRARWANGKRD